MDGQRDTLVGIQSDDWDQMRVAEGGFLASANKKPPYMRGDIWAIALVDQSQT